VKPTARTFVESYASAIDTACTSPAVRSVTAQRIVSPTTARAPASSASELCAITGAPPDAGSPAGSET
jgi:hypothetical protein